MTFKVFNSIVLLGKAYTLIEEKEKMEFDEQQNKKFDKQEFVIDPNSLEKFNQVYQKTSMKARFPSCAESNLSQSIPNIHEKCQETELRKFDSVMELPVTSHRKVDIHSDVLEEKQENGCNDTNVKEADLNVSHTQERQGVEADDSKLSGGHSEEKTVRRRTFGGEGSEMEDPLSSSPNRKRLPSTESTV